MAKGRLALPPGFGWPLPVRLGLRLLLVAVLVLSCLASALAVIATSHATREQYARLQHLEREHQQLQTEWGQLLLEEGAWSSPARIERLAVERLDMRLPAIEEIEVVTP